MCIQSVLNLYAFNLAFKKIFFENFKNSVTSLYFCLYIFKFIWFMYQNIQKRKIGIYLLCIQVFGCTSLLIKIIRVQEKMIYTY